MRVAIDARMLGPKQGGLGRYVEELTKNLNCHPERSEGSLAFESRDSSVAPLPQNDNQFVVFLRQENWDLVEEKPGLKKVLADIPWYGWKEQLRMPGIIKKEKPDLIHFPHWNVPLFYREPFVVTIHDLLLLHYPTRRASTLGPISYFFKNIAYRIVLRRAIYRAKKIIAISEFTKQDILKNFNVAAEKIVVTPLGVTALPACHCERAERAWQSPSLSNGIASSPLRAPRNDINKPYVLYVGVAYPHKNLDGLLRAWKIFCEKYGNGYQLVLAGRKNYFYERLMKEWIPAFAGMTQKETGLPARNARKRACVAGGLRRPDQSVGAPRNDTLIFTDYVPDEELSALYKNASLYVFPSLYEGFGLPPLEAMAHGLPVVSSNRASLPEVLGDAVLYFNPEKPEEMAAAIHRGLTDENLRLDLRLKGEKLIHKYSWENTAKQTLAAYEKVL